MLYEYEIFLTGLFFILFFIILLIFGFLLIFFLYKDVINLPFLVIIGISLGSGIVCYVCYSYIIETFLHFNFFTILLPIIIFIIGGLLYFIQYNLKLKQKLKFPNIKRQIIKIGKDIIIFIIFFIVIFYFQLQLQYDIIIKFESQLAADPFLWCRFAMHLLDYGHLEYSEVGFYSAGFIFLNAGMNLFYPNYRFIFFFHKFVPIFYMSLIIILGYIISSILFKQKFLRFLTMFGFLCLNYFNYRFLMPLGSILATISFFIFLIAFIDSKIPFYFKGILLAGPILFHPLYGAMGLIIYIIYIIHHFFILKVARKENKRKIYRFLKVSLYNILIFFGLLIPLLINLTLNYTIWFQRYWNTLFPSTISIIKLNTNLDVKNFPILQIGKLTPEKFTNALNYIVSQIWSGNQWIIFFLLYFLFCVKKKNYKKFENLIEIVKISIIFSFLFYFMYFLINWFFPLKSLDSINNLFYIFKLRIFEFNAGIIVLMFVFTVKDIYILFRSISLKLKNKFPKYKKFLNGGNLRTLNKKIYHIVKSPWKIESIIIIISFWFSYNLYQENKFHYQYIYRDNNFIEMIISLGELEPPNPDTKIKILLPVIEPKVILNLLYRHKYQFITFDRSYTELINIIINTKASYVVLPIREISEGIIRNLVFSYEIYFKNSKYMVIKIE